MCYVRKAGVEIYAGNPWEIGLGCTHLACVYQGGRRAELLLTPTGPRCSATFFSYISEMGGEDEPSRKKERAMCSDGAKLSWKE